MIETTGPSAYCLGLFLTNEFSAEAMIKKVNPVAMGTYGLDKSFKSTNGYPLHVDVATKQAFCSAAQNDASWKFFGMRNMHQQEARMNEAALKIQHWWRR